MKKNNIIAAFTALAVFAGAASYTGAAFAGSGIAAGALDYTYAEQDGITYCVYEDHAMVKLADGAVSGDVVIPETIEGKPVTVIGSKAFSDRGKRITGVTFPDTLEEIGIHAFASTAVREIELPAGLRKIGAMAFYECTELEKVSFPDGLMSIGEGAFCSCGLREFDLPDSLSEIGACAFCDMPALESVTIPGNVSSMGEMIFQNCSSLKKAVIEDGITYIPFLMFAEGASLTEVVLPDTLREIGQSAFMNTALEKIDIPESVRYIGDNAFYSCGRLTTLDIPEGVEEIGSSAFSACKELSEVSFPSTLYSIGEAAFSFCRSLQTVSFNEGLEIINGYAFEYTGLTSVVLPESVRYIGYNAFCSGEDLESFTVLNRNCMIDDSAGTISDRSGSYGGYNGVIYGYEYSTAQEYAESNGYRFTLLPDKPEAEMQPATEPEYEGSNPRIMGDLNGDGFVDSSDASLMLDYYAYRSTGGSRSLKSFLGADGYIESDFNYDYCTDASDASMILEYYSYTATGGTDMPDDYFYNVYWNSIPY